MTSAHLRTIYKCFFSSYNLQFRLSSLENKNEQDIDEISL